MPSRPALTAKAALAGLALPTGLLLAACSGAVPVPPVADYPPACETLRKELPTTVGGVKLDRTVPNSPSTAAWGNPPIVLRCGVDMPPAFRPDSEVIGIDGVDWFAEDLPDGYRFTTFGRPTNVGVFVPNLYHPQVNPLVDLSEAIKSALPIEEDSLPAP